jgi:hypothetical protein
MNTLGALLCSVLRLGAWQRGSEKSGTDKRFLVTDGYKKRFFIVESMKNDGFLNCKFVFDSRRGHQS